jgi:acyl-CoA synthetase (NDP forming)
MADEASDAGVELPETPDAAQARILARVAFAATRNPVDVTGQVGNDHEVLDIAIDALLESGLYDGIALFFSIATLAEAGPLNIASCLRMRERFPQVTALIISALRDEQRRTLEDAGCLCFGDPSRAVRSFAAMAKSTTAPGLPARPGHAPLALRAGPHSEPESLNLLAAAGLPVVPFKVATNRQEAGEEVAAIGSPAAMKIVSADILHKTDAGGVRLNITSPARASEAYDSIIGDCRKHAPGARIDGVMVAPMIRGGLECILGIKRDPVFGPVVMVGLGGIYVEVFRDVALRLAPFGLAEARAMIASLRARALFDGVRGQPPVDKEALARALVSLSDFAVTAGSSIESVDLNPFVVLPDGAIALDAVIIGAANQQTPPSA